MRDTSSFATFLTLPRFIDAPGDYLTRAGERVTITSVGRFATFDCRGAYSCGTPEGWNVTGRLYFGAESQNDIISKA